MKRLRALPRPSGQGRERETSVSSPPITWRSPQAARLRLTARMRSRSACPREMERSGGRTAATASTPGLRASSTSAASPAQRSTSRRGTRSSTAGTTLTSRFRQTAARPGLPCRGRTTTDCDPVGAAYGQGYTGSSGGWVQEEVDLSAYAGQKGAGALRIRDGRRDQPHGLGDRQHRGPAARAFGTARRAPAAGRPRGSSASSVHLRSSSSCR